MKAPTVEQIIIIVLIALLYFSYSSDKGYRYQAIDTFKVFDKKTGIYYDMDGKLDLINNSYTKQPVKQN